MVAQKSRLRLTLMLIGLFALLSGSATGQQTPSQRYQPNRDGFAPPSVHVAPQQMQKIPPKFRGSNAYYQSSPATKQPAFAGAKYTFSDQNASHTERRSSARSGSESQTQTQVPFETGTIQQTSYQVDEEGRPVVPAILAGGTNPAPAKLKVTPGATPSHDRVPVGFNPKLDASTREQRRRHSHDILKVRQEDVKEREMDAYKGQMLQYSDKVY